MWLAGAFSFEAAVAEAGTAPARVVRIAEEHSENVTFDPIVSMDGKKWAAQIIFKGLESLSVSSLPDIPGVVASLTPSVRAQRTANSSS